MVWTDELVFSHLLKLYFCSCILTITCVNSVALPDDFRQLNDKLVEVNTSKMALQMKLDELEAVEVNIKVSYIVIFILINYILTSHVSGEKVTL